MQARPSILVNLESQLKFGLLECEHKPEENRSFTQGT